MRNVYTKVFSLGGYYFSKEYRKTVKGKNVQRQILEETVRKNFKRGDCDVEIVFEETGKRVLITPDSSPEEIERYLGPKLLG